MLSASVQAFSHSRQASPNPLPVGFTHGPSKIILAIRLGPTCRGLTSGIAITAHLLNLCFVQSTNKQATPPPATSHFWQASPLPPHARFEVMPSLVSFARPHSPLEFIREAPSLFLVSIATASVT